MKKLCFAAYLLALGANAEASVIVGNSVIGPFAGGSTFEFGQTQSVGFLTGSNALFLDNIQVALGGTRNFSSSMTFTLNSDADGVPGSVIATIGSQTFGTFADTAVYTLTPASPLSLAPNTTYWIHAASPDFFSQLIWRRTTPSNAPSSGLATFIGWQVGGGGFFSPSGTYNAIIAEGHIAAVPEPEIYSMLLVGLGLVGFIALRRKHAE